MSKTFSEFDAKKQELNCGINTIPLVKYMVNIFGEAKTREYIEPLGLPISFLTNKRNWISYNYYIALLEKLVEVTGDENAPFKISFIMPPASIFEDIYYAAYATIFWRSPKYIYKLISNSLVYSRYQKVCDFKIISSKANSVIIEVTHREGYKQHKYNCLSIQGYLALCPVGCGLSPAIIEHKECAADNSNKCTYVISWDKKSDLFAVGAVLLFGGIVGAGFVFFREFFNTNILLITAFAFFSGYLLIRNFKQLKEIRKTEIFNYNKNNSVLAAMIKIENDYNEILETKIKLEGRNKFLTIFDEVNRKIAIASNFNDLLFDVTKILVNQLQVNKAAFFSFDEGKSSYFPLFELNNSYGHEGKSEIVIGKQEFFNIKKYNKYVFNRTDFEESSIQFSADLINWLDLNKNKLFYFMTIDLSKNDVIFMIMAAENEVRIANDIINSLFENISAQLRIGYQKISSREVIENILTSIPDNVMIVSVANNKIKYINDNFLRSLFPIHNMDTGEDIIDHEYFSLLPFDENTLKQIEKSIGRVIRNKEIESFETALGSMIIKLNFFSIPDNNLGDKLVGIVLSDISEEKHFQQKLLINEKLLALGKVASGIAHEINNPLYAVLANAEEIVDDENINDDNRKFAEEIIDHVMNVSNIVKDLSKYSKTLRKEEHDMVNINDVVEESLKLVNYSSNFVEIDVDKDLNAVPSIKAAKGEIQQIFINIINNAIHAMNGKGKLAISTNFEDDKLTAKISDTGTGMSEDVRNHIFDLYFTTKKAGVGTGQGLHIIKKIVDMYKGTIEVETELGKGTTFIITFIPDLLQGV